MSVLTKEYQDKIVAPFLHDLEMECSKSLKAVLSQSSAVAKATVEYALEREDARYERESKEKEKIPSNLEVAELVASHINFIAAEGAFRCLREFLMKTVS
jgi:hypothetical protein